MNSEKIKKYIPHFLLVIYENIRIKQRNSLKNLEKEYNNWLSKGKPAPPPHVVKQKAVEEFKNRFKLNTLIETGTFLGDMVFSQKENFDKLISIELDNTLYKDAKNKFKKFNNIEIVHGDSGKILNKICSNLEESCLFWLDGHYSAGFTAKGELESPVMAELESIFGNDIDHIILIDDARCFNGENDYPALPLLKSVVLSKRKDYTMEVADDIIRFYPVKNKLSNSIKA